jgi:PilZ domain
MARPLSPSPQPLEPQRGLPVAAHFGPSGRRADVSRQVTPPDADLVSSSLRKHKRISANIRAILYIGKRFQPVLIRDISGGGAGLAGCPSMLAGDYVSLGFLNGRQINARVRWWFAGACGVQFESLLNPSDILLSVKINQVETPQSTPPTAIASAASEMT